MPSQFEKYKRNAKETAPITSVQQKKRCNLKQRDRLLHCLRAGVYFSVYEATKRVLCPEVVQAQEDEPMWVVAFGGATTGAITWAVKE